MAIFGWGSKLAQVETASPQSMGNLRFMSTIAFERNLDGTLENFNKYFFAIYGCSINEQSGIKNLRNQLREQFPSKAVEVGENFVLVGDAAFRALSAYYEACIQAESLTEGYRGYMREHLVIMTKKHTDSQSLPIPIDLTEGQLNHDERLEFFTCIALLNGQVVPSNGI